LTPQEYAREKAARSGSTLHYALLFVPAERRAAVTALHAFAREIDEIAREASDPAIARAKLGWWKNEIAALETGKAQHPLARALRDERVALTSLRELVSSAEIDLDYNAYPDFGALEEYLRRSGGALAAATAEVLGYSDARTLECAAEIGVAVRLARIIRDVRIDAQHRRMYLPLHELAEYGVTTDDIERARETDAFLRLIRFQVDRAEQRFGSALAQFPHADRKRQRGLLAIAAIHRAVLREIRDDGCHVLTRRVALTPVRKLWLAWRV